MASPAFGLESAPSTEVLDVVQVAVPEEVVETLKAGANIVTCENVEIRTIEEDEIFGGSYVDHANPIKTGYIVGGKEIIDEIAKVGVGERDDNLYAPYSTLKFQTGKSLPVIYDIIGNTFGNRAKLDTSGNYIWDKKHEK